MHTDNDYLSFYAEDFTSSRNRFIASVSRLDAELHTLDVPCNSPHSLPSLPIEIAILGDHNSSKKLIYVAGTHGVEGFVGSAIQYGIIQQLARPPQGYSLILVHCLNPWGMFNLRRTNENNVDLNRNCVFGDAAQAPAPPHYEALRPILIPDGPSSFPSFTLKALAQVARLGFSTVKQAVTGGQYVDPHGIFFGGYKLQQELVLFSDWAKRYLANAGQVIVVDLHSGLGKFGDYTLLIDHPLESEEHLRAVDIFGASKVHGSNPQHAISYITSGSLGGLLPQVIPQAKIDHVVHEFGTLHPFKVLHALVHENLYFHSNSVTKNTPLERPGALILKKTFCPDSPIWRRNAVLNGLAIFNQAAARLLKR